MSTNAQTPSGFIVKSSPYNVEETLDRLEKIIEAKDGINVMGRIDHAKNAATAGLSLADTQVLIFGNAQIGTPLMQSNPLAAIDLPLKVLAWEDSDGTVHVGYLDPQALAERFGITDQSAIIEKMTGALNALTGKATEAP
ncbi:DUF302 domain-containing protein [Kordiimonas aquimaris]|uniref:DUF302 domain-containing protein n=1 Tax=Kordiimonas aquimaris TaxID=707591 RepID=UPI0021D29D44|nr:DUF302 domain-containing protein [Kordiimonas aquimaris]